MALPATDDFAGTGAIGANWTVVLGAWSRNANTAQSDGSTHNLMFWNADSFNADQKATVTITNDVAGGPAVRVSATGGGAGYTLYVTAGSIDIYPIVSGAQQSSIWNSASGVSLGDVLRLEAEGTTIRLYKQSGSVGDFVLLNTPSGTTDSQIASGSPGLYCWNVHYGMDDFVGDNLGAAPPSGPSVTLDEIWTRDGRSAIS